MLKNKYYIVSIILITLMILSTVKISLSTNKEDIINSKIDFFKPVINKLLKQGVDSSFIIKLIQDDRTQFDDKYVKINVTGFLKKADYSHNFNAYSVQKSKDFLVVYDSILTTAQNLYSVPKEVITSILWVETKHGSILGGNHIVSVYLSTAMCNNETYLKMNKDDLIKNFKGTNEELIELENKIVQRSEKKSKWAIEQLVSLEKLDKLPNINVLELKGSTAGAFGLAQFLPASFLKWAVDGNFDGIINLFDVEDAIFSVANYLKTNGWDSSLESQRKAVFHYNNLNMYVDAVFTLADKIKPEIIIDSLNIENQVIPGNDFNK